MPVADADDIDDNLNDENSTNEFDDRDDDLDDDFDDDDDDDDDDFQLNRTARDPNRPVEPPLWEQMAAPSAELPQGERLQKVLAVRGWGSRRVCEDMISDGRVTVNGEVAVLGRRVDTDHDLVEVDGVPIGVKPGLVYYLLNKPDGVVTTAHDPQGRPTVVETGARRTTGVPRWPARLRHRRPAAADQRRRPGPPAGAPQPWRGEGVPGRGQRRARRGSAAPPA